jgi:hypothetical protein
LFGTFIDSVSCRPIWFNIKRMSGRVRVRSLGGTTRYKLTGFNGSTVHAGAGNVYGTAILRLPLAYENFNLRSTLNLGTSYLVSNLYGGPSGSVGIFAGLSFLGLECKMSRAFLLIIHPLSFAVSAPQLKNVPLFYPQYRMSLGLELYLG